ncbi:Divalent-cation tolerance protein CutA [Rubripirellula amarantea]|uniref:Divalent-cation tolerance protein CutA n=1 Tax=Rubripirellula amarantea TaxID=2527999 RepID=A0A5C5WTN1_9BACT|nr:divalent-cation tolerance protein CutA [Rubripirellula amarantea]TWT54036.1 Divalent-cation tolerance protein CutA [Rubripirellula amarantea]
MSDRVDDLAEDMANGLAYVTTTVANLDDAEKLAGELVSQSLAACVQIDGPITSHYRWAGKVQTSSEYRLSIKTSQKAWPRLLSKLPKMHPYEEPEIIMTKIDQFSPGYGSWVIDQTT